MGWLSSGRHVFWEPGLGRLGTSGNYQFSLRNDVSFAKGLSIVHNCPLPIEFNLDLGSKLSKRFFSSFEGFGHW